MKEQILNDSKGNPIGFFLTLDEYNELKEQIEDLEDTIAYLKDKLENDIEPVTPIHAI